MIQGEKIQRDYRQRLLARIHIAKKEFINNDDELYRKAILMISEGRTNSATDLDIEELEALIAAFKEAGWRPGDSHDREERQIFSLKKRAKELASEMPYGRHRLAGLCRKICGVDHLSWVKDIGQLKQLLAAMKAIRDRGEKGER